MFFIVCAIKQKNVTSSNIKFYNHMGLFNSLKAKRYWRNHTDERRQIEKEGTALLTEFNNLILEMNVTPDVEGYAAIRERIFYILDWFIELEKRKCPYHLIGGAENKRKDIAMAFNNGLLFSVKRTTDDFDKAIKLLIEKSNNYDSCKKAIIEQKKANGNYFRGTAARFVGILKDYFDNNIILPEPLIACGLPTEIVLSHNSEEIEKYKPAFNQQEKDDFNAYFLALKNRYHLAHDPLVDMSAYAKAYNINLKDGELIYQRIRNVSLSEEMVVNRIINYGGVKYSYGMVRGGHMNYSTNAIKDFRIQDIGAIFITNKRILFVGSQRHKTVGINISSVVNYELFQDSIILRIENRPNCIMFRFEPIQRTESLLMLQDGINSFVSIIDRIIGNTENEKI